MLLTNKINHQARWNTNQKKKKNAHPLYIVFLSFQGIHGYPSFKNLKDKAISSFISYCVVY